MEGLSVLEEVRVSGSSATVSTVGEGLIPGGERWCCTWWRWGGEGVMLPQLAPGVRRGETDTQRGRALLPGAQGWGLRLLLPTGNFYVGNFCQFP